MTGKGADDLRPPPLRLLLAELGVAGVWLRARVAPRRVALTQSGTGAPVITLPGFCAGDLSMAQMRKTLRASGYRARGWGLGPNLGARADLMERLDERVRDVTEREGRPAYLVGWSLGGVFAREYAKRHPGRVAGVISMGSPFSGSRRANNAWRLYRVIAGHSVDDPPVPILPDAKPPVPTVALWSARDGVVAPASARGRPDESDAAIELACRHLGFAYAPDAVAAVARCLADMEAGRIGGSGVSPR